MDIHCIETKHSELRRLPEEVATYLVMSLAFANELSFLLKAILASMPTDDPPTEWEGALQTSQVLFYTEIAAGKLYEFWRCTEKVYLGQKVAKSHHGLLDAQAREAFDRLKQFFGDPRNEIKTIRREFAFHSDAHRIREALRSLDPATPCRLILSRHHTNVFFEFASGISHRAMLCATTGGEFRDARDLIQKLVVPRLMDALKFAHGYGVVVFGRLRTDDAPLGKVAARKIAKLELPFFVER